MRTLGSLDCRITEMRALLVRPLTHVRADREGQSAKLSEGDRNYRLRLAGCGRGRPLNSGR